MVLLGLALPLIFVVRIGLNCPIAFGRGVNIATSLINRIAPFAWHGAERDRQDKSKWHTEQGPLSVTGPEFTNWRRCQGGGGAIDLVIRHWGRRRLRHRAGMAGTALRGQPSCSQRIRHARSRQRIHAC